MWYWKRYSEQTWGEHFPSLIPISTSNSTRGYKMPAQVMMGCADDSRENSPALTHPSCQHNENPNKTRGEGAGSVLVAGSLCTDEENNRVAGVWWFILI